MKQTNHPQKAILLVEGRCDVEFLKALLPQLLPKPNIPVLTPTECGGYEDNIDAVFRTLPQLLMDINEERLQRLGIIVDADYTNRNGGFAARWKTFTGILQKAEYIINSPPDQAYTGSIFQHDCGLPPVGLWIMPNHKGDGMLEDFIKQAIGPGQPQKLLERARGCVDQLPKDLKLFSEFHQTKADVYTWLAWQEQPGQSFANLFPKVPKSSQPSKPPKSLIDLESDGIKGFKGWLEQVFM
jgi:hypothetical protein